MVWQGDAEFGKYVLKQVPKIVPKAAPSALKAAGYMAGRAIGPLAGNLGGALAGQILFPSTAGAGSMNTPGAQTLEQQGAYKAARFALQTQQSNEQKHNQSAFRFFEPRPQPLDLPKEIVAKLSPSDIKALGQEFSNALVGKVLKTPPQAPTSPRAP